MSDVARAIDGAPQRDAALLVEVSPAIIDVSLALYVHMPWCVRKCPYCDFNSHQLKSAGPDRAYIDALLRDFAVELPRLTGRRIDTVFFGGGTPSLFQPEDLHRLLTALRDSIEFAADVEVTLEANPGTIERGRFTGYRDAGINRVSLGAQTFAPRALQALGRIHSADDTHRAVQELRAAKLDNFNLDLMYALPQQSFEDAMVDVRTACDLQPSHISYYQLTLEPGTVFHARPPPLPDEDTAWRIQSEGQKLLAAGGFEQYEISAYARGGAQCRHNLNYWLFGDYVGIGAGAHGKLSLELPQRVLRTVKPKQPREYLDQVRRVRLRGDAVAAAAGEAGCVIGETSVVAAGDLPFEFMLNALRLKQGFSIEDYRRGTGLALESIEAKLRLAQRLGLLAPRPGGFRATEFGRRFLNDLQGAFLP
ncbi:MAG: radical SAM family heme chaperone HemW [Pseudomonadota bacterium]|nr:radical SAM family heme chaperone HemW [Pseudomonadota bacterium]